MSHAAYYHIFCIVEFDENSRFMLVPTVNQFHHDPKNLNNFTSFEEETIVISSPVSGY